MTSSLSLSPLSLSTLESRHHYITCLPNGRSLSLLLIPFYLVLVDPNIQWHADEIKAMKDNYELPVKHMSDDTELYAEGTYSAEKPGSIAYMAVLRELKENTNWDGKLSLFLSHALSLSLSLSLYHTHSLSITHTRSPSL